MSAEPYWHHAYILEPIVSLLPPGRLTILDAGSGNGSLSAKYAALGHRVIGIEIADDIEVARTAFPTLSFHRVSVYDDLSAILPPGGVDVAIACEVIEHLYDPGAFLEAMRKAIKPGGTIILTTPYHGYLKNLALSVAGKWDFHFHPGNIGGHIKFFSRRTLSELMAKRGFSDLRFRGAGRVPYLWKSLVACGVK